MWKIGKKPGWAFDFFLVGSIRMVRQKNNLREGFRICSKLSCLWFFNFVGHKLSGLAILANQTGIDWCI